MQPFADCLKNNVKPTALMLKLKFNQLLNVATTPTVTLSNSLFCMLLYNNNRFVDPFVLSF